MLNITYRLPLKRSNKTDMLMPIKLLAFHSTEKIFFKDIKIRIKISCQGYTYLTNTKQQVKVLFSRHAQSLHR